MYQLRDRIESNTAKKQFRQVTGRMVTDIEMNGTIRGAVEEVNLCTNLRQNDCLFAECIRSFPIVDVNAQQWLHRLSIELDNMAHLKAETYVPATKRPNIRTDRSKAPAVDVYGFRQLNTPFGLLAPFEFSQYWYAEPVMHPPFDEDTDDLSRWTETWRALRR